MLIKEMFVKNIERDIQSVVKVSSNKENEIVEIDEYVVTDEIFNCIKNFVSTYKNTFLNKNDQIGFWISGFFGSGKSHFLKILYYILKNFNLEILIKNNNCLVEIKEELDFLSNITKDVILFNIDSKKDRYDSILDIFVNEFNSMRGFSKSHGFICELEEQLVKENIFDEFKSEFLKYSNNIWENVREEFYLYTDGIYKSLSIVKNFSYSDAESYFLNIEKNYKMNIEKFSNKVASYVKQKGGNHNVVFMVDEVSQFISNDINRMLNLQTIVEEFSNKCAGNVFVIVTSHVDIMTMTKDKKYDFSKIQSRFVNKFYLSSVNMNEILYKRLLCKNEVYSLRIKKFYKDKKFILKSIFKFDFISDFDLFKVTEDEFISAYPFLPYQISLLREVIYFMMKNNVISDDVSRGERSIINFFQRVLINFKNFDVNKIVPFYMFYEPIFDFIDYNHKYIFSMLSNHQNINIFDINILKTLFLIKYVPNLLPTVDTISSLMICNINDRGDIKNQVYDSLKKLINEGFINNDGDRFYFLSKIERDINYKIISSDINTNEIKNFLCNEIFNNVVTISKIKYKNKITFTLNKILGDINYKQSSKNLIGIKILLTNYDEKFDIDSVRILSSIENNVIMYLSDDKNLIQEINIYLKLEKFLKYNKIDLKDNFKDILLQKEIELKNRLERIQILIIDSIKNSYIFVNGERFNVNYSDINELLKKSINYLVFCRFNKLSYINKFIDYSKSIIEFLENENHLNNIINVNSLFLTEIFNFLSEFSKIKLSDIVNHFKNIPYGFGKNDILFAVLYFLKFGKISCNYAFDEVVKNISDKVFLDKIEIIKLNDLNLDRFNYYKKFFGQVFNKKYLFTDLQKFFEVCKEDLLNLNSKISKIKNLLDKNPLYPGKKFIYNLENILQQIITNTSDEFIDKLNSCEYSIEDFEQFEIIYNFYTSIQFDIFNNAVQVLEIFNKDKNFIDDDNLKDSVSSIDIILKNENPYGEISKLNVHISKFLETHREILNYTMVAVDDFIEIEISKFIDDKLVNELKNKLKNCSTLFDVYGIKMEGIFLKDKNLKLED